MKTIFTEQEAVREIMKSKKSTKKIRMLRAMMVVCAVIFVVSGFMLVRDYIVTSRQQETFDQLAGQFVQETETAPEVIQESGPQEEKSREEQWVAWWEETAQSRFPVYRTMKEENGDMIGWIHIEGTNVDYPVMQSPASPDYYLHRDFHKQNSSYGTPYLDEYCKYTDPRTSLLIYGHHMKNGSMFASLEHYTDRAFYEEHPFVQFDTLDEAGTYEVAAVIKVDATGDQTIWQDLLFPEEETDFAGAWDRVKKQSFYDTGLELSREDELLALVTCEYTLKDGRTMVIAKRIGK